ncbi:metallophosphatase [Marivirga tractuosa]|uniref:Metallophosphoesterase n=1 Tax=Marivirga tractuosa (strain ATCC 23168 / DSM 4126 / NBRC 15989 / NCIMB 1408 / VKM B-1430 / H-43) TaxID=643867 RepID=E4TN79_MARTH|nr:metallophosphoesterase [Marivirga tractuosa]ADR23467.1 metallophosphoesterase [Marivirga tractuosa DSM 4126]BDD15856.1 metallophosphatase [Marivirga tractuosa]
MKIQFASDLHLEFMMNKVFIEKYPLEAKGDILILAGDIIPFNMMHAADNFFDYVSDNFEMVYWIPGNHEYYQSDINERSGSFQEQIRDNVILLNNKSIHFQDYKIIYSTLWTSIGDQYANDIKRGMNDFRVIKDDGLSLRPKKYNQLHEDCLSFIQKELEECSENEKSVVVTHHVPTKINYPSKYQGSILNEAFAVELEPFIKEFKPNYWIYGHHHANRKDFQIGETQLMTNQLGYIDLQEQEGFKPDRLIF